MSREVGGVLIYHQWSLGADLEPPVINFFSGKHIFSRTSGNVLNGILTLSVRQTDASGAHLGLTAQGGLTAQRGLILFSEA